MRASLAVVWNQVLSAFLLAQSRRTPSVTSAAARPPHSRRRRSVSSSLLALAAVATTAFWAPVRAVDDETVTFQDIPVGSYIVDMGQATQTVANGLKPYGLVYDLVVNRKVPVFWAIAPGKLKTCLVGACTDGVDFTTPTKTYRGGTFIISGAFVDAPALTAINAWRAKGVVVDGPTTAVIASVPIYDRLTSMPRAVLDLARGSLVVPYFAAAEIPASAYVFKAPSALNACDDMYVMPHADPTWATHSALVPFVTTQRGYLWAACHAVSVLENVEDPAIPGPGPDMNFLSTTGLVSYLSHVAPVPPFNYAATAGDDPVMQFLNRTDAAHLNGSERVYLPKKIGAWRPETTIAVFDPDHPNIPVVSDGPAAIIAYGRAFGASTNGRVMYEGGHSHSATAADAANLPAYVAAQRAFFNFFLLAGIDRRPELTTTALPASLTVGQTVSLSASITGGGAAPFTYQWTSSCGGTFSSPTTATTDFTAPSVAASTNCAVKVTVVDSCGRVNFAPIPTVITPVQSIIGIAKSVGAPTEISGQVFDVPYTLTVQNLGLVPLTNVQVADNLAATFPSPATTSITVAPTASAPLSVNPGFTGTGANTRLLTGTNTLPVGPAVYTISFTVRVDINSSGGTYANQATATSAATPGGTPTATDLSNNGPSTAIDPNGNGNPSDPGENTPTSISLSQGVADVVVVKSGPATVAANGTITYTILVRNDGPNRADDTIFFDTLPAGFTVSTPPSCVPSAGGAVCGAVSVGAGNTVTSTITRLRNGESVTFTIVGTAPASGSLVNTARAVTPAGVADPTDPGDTGAGNNSSSVTTAITANGTVSGHVFSDIDGDGIQDPGEPDLSGLTVTITPATGAPITVTTDVAGNYVATVPPGLTTVNVTDPPGTVLTTGNDPQTVTAVSGADTASAAVGFQPASGLTGTVFNDANGSGVRDAGEAGLGTVTIEVLAAGPDGLLGTADDIVVRTAQTDATGAFAVPGLASGAYLVRETDPAGFASTTPNVVAVTVPFAGTASAVFADQQQSSVSGTVFNDLNGNGVRDAGEPGIPGVAVTLDAAGPDGVVGSADDVPAGATVTDGAGGYSFASVAPGAYVVTETDPAGFTSTTPNEQAVSVPPGGVASAQFGDQQQGTVSGTVFNDVNGDGTQDATEVGLSGVTVRLMGAGPDGVLGTPDDVVVATIATNAAGGYSFAGVAPGTYLVTETDPATYASTTPNAVPVTVPAGGSANAQFGDQQQATIGGTVFNDADGSTIQDAGEPGLAGVTVELLNATGAVVATAVTDASGTFSFTSVAPGSYTVREIDPLAFASTTPNAVGVTLPPGGSASAQFGDQQQGTIAGVVFNDLNGDGESSATEPGLGGVTVELRNASGAVVATTTTLADGTYRFSGVPPGAYTVVEIDPAGFGSTTANSVPVTLPAGGTASASFGDQPVGSVTGVVFNDVDGNGVQNPGEVGLGGVTVVIRNSSGVVVATVTTLPDGSFTALGLPAGTYTVEETDPAGFASTTPNLVSVTVPVGGVASAAFGDRLTGTVGGVVFDDANANGIQDPGEGGIAGVTIELRDATNVVVGTAVTTSSGAYAFLGVPTGNYTVIEIDPAGFASTTSNSLPVVVPAGGSASASFGDRLVGTLTGHVFLDPDGSGGTQDAGEPNLAGIVVTITPSSGAPFTVPTDASGNFTAVVPVGATQVSAAAPAGHVLTTDNSPQSVSVVGGATAVASMIGFQPVGTITGVVFSDLNGDGVQGPGEPPLAGISITITPAIGPPIAVTTDALGNYSALVPAGPVTVAAVGPTGTSLTTANNGQTVNVTAGATATATPIGFQSAGVVAGVVFDDANGNGTRDGAEGGLSGVTVQLVNATTGAVVATTTTAADGSYTFPSVPSGSYLVRETDPAGYTSTTPNVVPVTVVSGTTAVANFGDQVGSTVSGVVFDDLNGNGVQDSGEAGLAGVTMRLTSAATGAILTTTTDATGAYTFTGLAPGGYTVTEVDPAGYVSTTPNIVTVTAPLGGTASANFGDQRGLADIAVTATGPTGVSVGDVVTYRLPVSNLGPAGATDVRTAVVIPPGLDIGTATPTQGTLNPVTGEWVIGALPVGANVEIVFVASVTLPSLGPVTIVKTHADQVDPVGANDSAATTPRTPSADVQVEVDVLNAQPPAGSPATFTVTITNAGPDGVSGLIVSVPIPPGMTLVSATPGAGSYDPVTGRWTIGNMAPGAVLTMPFVATALSTVETVLVASVASAVEPDPNPRNNASSAVIHGTPVDLQVVVTVDNSRPIVGGTVRLVVTVSNNGPSPATAVEVTLLLPPGLTFVAAAPSQGNYDSTTGQWSVGALPAPGPGSSVTLEILATVATASPVSATAALTGVNETDVVSPNNSAAAPLVPTPWSVAGTADLEITQQVQPTVLPGGQVVFTFTVVNRGPGPAVDVDIAGHIPAGTTFVSAGLSPGGSCTPANPATDQELMCVWPGVTLPGQTRQLTLALQVSPTTPPGSTVWAWFMAMSPTPDPYEPNNVIDGYVFVGGQATSDLAIQAIAEFRGQRANQLSAPVGQDVRLRFQVQNLGAVTASGQYALILDQANGLEIRSIATSQGSLAASGPTSGVWDTGPVAPGTSITADLVVRLTGATALRLFAQRVTATPADDNAVNDYAEIVLDGVAIGTGGRWLAVGDLDGVAGGEIVTGAGAGETPQVRVFNGLGADTGVRLFAYDRGFRGGVRLASCDINGDGRAEIVTAPGPGRSPLVRVLGLSGGIATEVLAFEAYEPSFLGGVFVACADLDGDGRAEIVTGPDAGRAPDVRVFTATTTGVVTTAAFSAYESTFTGGVRVAAVRYPGGSLLGAFSIATAPGAGRSVDVGVWSIGGGTGSLLAQGQIMGGAGGALVTIGDANGDGQLDLVATSDVGTPSLLRVFSLETGALLLDAPPNAAGFGNARVAVGSLAGGPGVPEIVVSGGPGHLPIVATFVWTTSGAAYQRLGFSALEVP